MKTGGQVAAAVALLGANAVQGAAPDDRRVTYTGALPTRELGKTRVKPPILGYGGAALPEKWGNSRSTEERVKLVRHAYDSHPQR